MTELDRVMQALSDYPGLPQDVFIGRNGLADKVTWLIQMLNAFEERGNDLKASRDGLIRTIEVVLADAESEHPGGWGPDVTMVEVLKRALLGEYPDGAS